MDALRETLRFYIVNFFEKLYRTFDKRASYFPRRFPCLICDETLPLVFNLLPEGVHGYYYYYYIIIGELYQLSAFIKRFHSIVL